jgi:hypothetical protein
MVIEQVGYGTVTITSEGQGDPFQNTIFKNFNDLVITNSAQGAITSCTFIGCKGTLTENGLDGIVSSVAINSYIRYTAGGGAVITSYNSDVASA